MPPVLTRASKSNAEGEDLSTPLTASELKGAQANEAITLYGFDYSPPAWKVRVLLSYYKVPYKYIVAFPGQAIDGLDNEYKKIPKLVMGERQINDSAVVYRALAPLLAGAALTEEQVELEARNNITGLLGALEREAVTSYSGIKAATGALISEWRWYNPLKLALPWAAGVAALPASLLFARMPHGKDGDSRTHGAAYRKALGEHKFFHGDAIGPLDLSVYATLAAFIKLFRTPTAIAVLDDCDLRAWYERCEAAVKADGRVVEL